MLFVRAGDADGAGHAVLTFVAVLIEKLDAVKGRGLAHGAGAHLDPGEVRQQHGRLRLAEALVQFQPRELLDFFIDLGV